MKMKDILPTGPDPDIFLMLAHNENNLSSSMNITENSEVLNFMPIDIDLGSNDFLEAPDEIVSDTQFRFASTIDPYMGIKQRMPFSIDDTESNCSQVSESGQSESDNTTTSTYSIKQRLHKTVLQRCKAEGKDLFQPEKDKEVIMPTKEEEAKTLERKERNKRSAKKSRESKKAAAEELKKENEKLKSQNSSLKASVQELEEKLRKIELIKREISDSNTEPRIQQEKNYDCFMATGANINDNLSFDALADYSPEMHDFIEKYLGQKDTQQDSQPLQHPEMSQLSLHHQEVNLSISNGNSSDSQLTVSGAVYFQSYPSEALPNNLHVKTCVFDIGNTYEPPKYWETVATENNGVSDQGSYPADSAVVIRDGALSLRTGSPNPLVSSAATSCINENSITLSVSKHEPDARANVIRDGGLFLRIGCPTPLISPLATSCINESSLTQSVSKHEPDIRANKRPSPWTVAEENKDDETTAELKEFFLCYGNKEPPEKKHKY